MFARLLSVQIQPLWTVVATGSLSEDGQSDWFASFPIGTHFSAVHYVTYVFRSVCVCARVRARVCAHVCVCARMQARVAAVHTDAHLPTLTGIRRRVECALRPLARTVPLVLGNGFMASAAAAS